MTLEGLAACPAKVTRVRENLGGWPFLPHEYHYPWSERKPQGKIESLAALHFKLLCKNKKGRAVNATPPRQKGESGGTFQAQYYYYAHP